MPNRVRKIFASTTSLVVGAIILVAIVAGVVTAIVLNSNSTPANAADQLKVDGYSFLTSESVSQANADLAGSGITVVSDAIGSKDGNYEAVLQLASSDQAQLGVAAMNSIDHAGVTVHSSGSFLIVDGSLAAISNLGSTANSF